MDDIFSDPVGEEGDGEVDGEEGQEGEEEEFMVSDDEVEIIVDHEQPDCYEIEEDEDVKKNLEACFERDGIKKGEEDGGSNRSVKGTKRDMPQVGGLQSKKSKASQEGSGGKDIKEGEQVKDEKQNETIQQPDETPAVLSDEEKDPSKAEDVTTKGTHKDILAGWVWLPCNRSKGVLRHFGTKGSFCRSSSIFFLDET